MATLFDKPKRARAEKRAERPWCAGCRRDHATYDLCPKCRARWDAEDAADRLKRPLEGAGPPGQFPGKDAPGPIPIA